jgi:hypothetical protein
MNADVTIPHDDQLLRLMNAADDAELAYDAIKIDMIRAADFKLMAARRLARYLATRQTGHSPAHDDQ